MKLVTQRFRSGGTSSPAWEQALIARFEAIRERLERTASAAGRAAALGRTAAPGSDGLRLVAVSKFHEAETVAALARHWASEPSAPGLPAFGESYAQEALEKMFRTAALLSAGATGTGATGTGTTGTGAAIEIHWHFVGHVQSRKAKDIVGRFDLIHSLDSAKLALALSRAWQTRLEGAPRGLDAPPPAPQSVLIQVNIGREPQKSGVDPDGLEDIVNAARLLPGLRLAGLMCLPPVVENAEESRPFFEALRLLRDRAEKNCGLLLPHLSMGMSDDFEAAVAEGATLVRIGTDIFGPRGKR